MKHTARGFMLSMVAIACLSNLAFASENSGGLGVNSSENSASSSKISSENSMGLSENSEISSKNSANSTQPKSISLDTITVTATKTPIKIEEVPANVGIVTGDDIRGRAAATDAYKAISHMAGVDSVGGGMADRLFIRGKTPSVLSNGRDMNFFSGITNSSATSMSSIDRIEVIKGPQAAIHGAKAVSGVVNIIRKKGDANHPFIETGVFARSGKGAGANLSLGGGVNFNGGGGDTHLLS